ncbi:MAG: hypothetical protein ABFR75_10830 [Acidobacteriota bacterium]
MGKSRAPFKVSDYLQISCLGKYSVEIAVKGSNNYKGSLIINKGQLWSAADNNGKGEEAFRRIILEKDSLIDCSAFNGKKPEKNIETEWEELLFKIYTKKDREIYLTKKTEEINSKVNEICVNKMLCEASEYLLEKNYEKAFRILNEIIKTDPGNKKALLKLTKLKKLGFE